MTARRRPRQRRGRKQSAASAKTARRREYFPLLRRTVKWAQEHANAALALAVTVVTLVGGALALRPQMSVIAAKTDPRLYLPLRFRVTNTGFFQMNSVRFECFFKDINRGVRLTDIVDDAEWSGTRSGATILRSGETATIECLTSLIRNNTFRNVSEYGDMAVLMRFTTLVTPWQQRRAFRFVSFGTPADWVDQPIPDDYFAHYDRVHGERNR